MKALALPKSVRQWTQGVDISDAAAAAGGLALSTILPGMLVKNTSTLTGKALKIGAGVLAAGAAGSIGSAMFNSKIGKAAAIGAMAGVFTQIISMLGIVKLSGMGSLGAGHVARQLGNASLVSPASSRQEEMVSLIQP